MRYAGFWPRLGAAMIDFLIVAPFAWYAFERFEASRMSHLYLGIPVQLAAMAVGLWLVLRFGGSIGKLVMGLRIRMLDGSPVTLRAAVMRFSVDWAFAVAGTVGMALAISKLTDAQFLGLDSLAQYELIDANQPAWAGPLEILFNIWVWSELIVMLTNEKRRALHDFIAGTVVIKLERERTLVQEPLVAE